MGGDGGVARTGPQRRLAGLRSALRAAPGRAEDVLLPPVRPGAGGPPGPVGRGAGDSAGGVPPPGGLFEAPADAVRAMAAQDGLRAPPENPPAARPDGAAVGDAGGP